MTTLGQLGVWTHTQRRTSIQVPASLTLLHDPEYYLQLAEVEHWTIQVRVLPICRKRYAALEYRENRATLFLNDEYLFSPRAASRAVVHELLELATIELWTVHTEVVANIPDIHARRQALTQMRDARDRYITRRLQHIPFWTDLDLPVLRTDIEALCQLSSRSKEPAASAKRPRLKFCMSDSDVCCQ